MRLKQFTTKDGFTIGVLPKNIRSYIFRSAPYYLVYDNTVVCRASDISRLRFFLQMYREDKSMLYEQVNRMKKLAAEIYLQDKDVYILDGLLDMPIHKAMLIIEDATSHGFTFHFHNGNLYARLNGFLWNLFVHNLFINCLQFIHGQINIQVVR